MNDLEKTTNDVVLNKVAERATWERPELTQFEATDAEGALGAGGDNVVFS